MATPSFKEKLVGWEVLSQNLKAQLSEIPHLQSQQEALAQLVAEGRNLQALQGMHAAALRDTNRQRFNLEKRGDEMRERLAGALRGQFGPKDTRLLEFGLKPKAERRRASLTPEQKKQQQVEQLKKKLAALESAASPGTP